MPPSTPVSSLGQVHRHSLKHETLSPRPSESCEYMCLCLYDRIASTSNTLEREAFSAAAAAVSELHHARNVICILCEAWPRLCVHWGTPVCLTGSNTPSLGLLCTADNVGIDPHHPPCVMIRLLYRAKACMVQQCFWQRLHPHANAPRSAFFPHNCALRNGGPHTPHQNVWRPALVPAVLPGRSFRQATAQVAAQRLHAASWPGWCPAPVPSSRRADLPQGPSRHILW